VKPPIVNGNRIAEYTLRRAVLVYEARHGGHYATLHPVTHDAGRASIGTGRALTESTLRTTLQALGAPKGIGGWVAPRVLYMDENTIVWHRPAGPRVMFFGGAADASLRNRSAVVAHPPLVFGVTRHGWYVAALPTFREFLGADIAVAQGDRRPAPGDPLMRAPYPNVYDDGRICEGNVTLPDRIALDTIEGFEDAFFDSKFTHSNVADACAHPQGLAGLWRRMFETKPEVMPDHYLTPMNLTLEQFVGRITKGRQ
jgi:PRTRC genetic system protein B